MDKAKKRATLTNQESIPAVIEDMTVWEKLNLVGAYKACDTLAIPDMNIPSTCWMDGATGVNGTAPTFNYVTDPEKGKGYKQKMYGRILELVQLNAADLSEARVKYAEEPDILELIDRIEAMRPEGRDFVSFPSGVNIGASFDRNLAKEVGAAIGQEMRNSKIDICLGPNVDIARDPLGGRNYEMYGEDPKLVGDIAVSVINGIQSTGTAACAKHFLANNQETNRNTKDTHLSERTLREMYSVSFERAVKEAGVKAIMSAYNAINGEFTSYSKKLLTDLLRIEWKFDGVVCSDWGAVTARKDEAIKAGMGLLICGPNDMTECEQAIEEGTFPVELLDQRVEKLLKLIVELRTIREKTPAHYDQKHILDICRKVITGGAVLLKNDQMTLPLKKENRIAVYGKAAKEFLECGTGSTHVITGLHSNVYDEIEKEIGENRVSFENMDGAQTLVYVATANAGENDDRKIMDIDEPDRSRMEQVLKEAKKKGLKTVVLLNIPGPIDMRCWIKNADSILCIFIPGCMGGIAACDLLYGKAVPAGKLPITMPMRYEDTPSYPYFPGEFNDVYYGEGVFIGYRSYEKRDIQVQYPFGYGLSYTSFEVELLSRNFRWDSRTDEILRIPVRVKNTGDYTGSEVVQIYASEVKTHVVRPVKELVGFEKVALAPGEDKIIEIEVSCSQLNYFDQEKNCWIHPVGAHVLSVGTSASDIVGTADCWIEGDNAYQMGADTLMSAIFADKKACEVIDGMTSGMLANISEEHRAFMVNMPLGQFLGMRIQMIPDAVALDQMNHEIYKKLAEIQ